MDCGPSCLRMIAKYYGRHFSLDRLRDLSDFSKDGVSLLGISNAAEKIGFKTLGVKINFEQLENDVPKPCIIYWEQNHFVVLPPQKRSKRDIIIADPASSMYAMDKKEFRQKWMVPGFHDGQAGIALLLEPAETFYEIEDEPEKKVGWHFLWQYVRQHKKHIWQLMLGIAFGLLVQLIFPFLTQAVVDTGIETNDLNFIYVILLAQFALSFSRTVVDFIKNRILLHISMHVNISILAGFWSKLMRLPLQYFDTQQTGDIMQRIHDHHRIEQFLTGNMLNTLFSFFTLVMFSGVLLVYNTQVFFIFLLGSLLYAVWILLFLKKRRQLDHKRFDIGAKESSMTIQLITGMQEIRLNNAEHLRRWEWEGIQGRLFKLNFRSLTLSQYQQAGTLFINEGKNLLITFFVAKAVLDGQLTIGAMLAIQSVIGQLNSPVEQLVDFIQYAQNAKMSLERLNEVHQLADEEPASKMLIRQIPGNGSIHFKNVSFSYPGAGNIPVLNDIDLFIPAGKITAIVGMSGSGKTTLLKLLLRFYEQYKGAIKVGDCDHKKISVRMWRAVCGNVLQDGFIFSDTIARNIAVSEEFPDHQKLLHACNTANIQSFINGLPLGLNTKIGAEGNGISQGQKQRILIARAVYKDPQYLFFDEATNALDANNEKLILENLNTFFKGRTVVVVAHRLSTVSNADKVVVLDGGRIVEEGSPAALAARRGHYYKLVKNQLELGN